MAPRFSRLQIGRKRARFAGAKPVATGTLGFACCGCGGCCGIGREKEIRARIVLNHVLLHQTVIGVGSAQEMTLPRDIRMLSLAAWAAAQLWRNRLPFLRGNLPRGRQTRSLAVEPTATPSLTRGVYGFRLGDSAACAILKMYTRA
jgi:tryptophan synthase beta chain